MARFDRMPRSRWERVDAVFREALERAPEERDEFLATACTGDADLRVTVEELLADVDAGGEAAVPASLRIDAGLIADVAGRFDRDPLEPGARVGAYRLVCVLGRGGSGTVFLAERGDGTYEQRVALKVLRRGLDTDDVLARFRAERQILAALNHPNISRLLDGGATEDGRPFIVMEAVDGEPITAYARRHGLGVRDRLRLFLVVAGALQYAHRRLVVHRDLKPSNILVEADGNVKLVDFGIAKLLDAQAIPGGPPATRAEVRLLTPEYATPEQVRGHPVTTATDTYQLGILLYELLVGRHPHPPSDARGSTLERVICETDPPLPSAAARDPGNGAHPPVGTAQRARALRGDLDRIIMKALEKEPERRYASVEQLAEDVERYLDGRPIRARPAGLGYRAGKFVRRHPAAMSAGGAALVATAALITTLLVNADRLEAERDRARIEAARAENVSDLLVELFSLPELGEGRGDTVTARGILDRGAERLLADREAVEAELRVAMLHVLGRAYVGLGLVDAAHPMLEASLALHDLQGGADPETAVEALLLLGTVHRERRDLDAAGESFAAAVAILDAMPEPRGDRLADGLHGLALTLRIDPTMRDSATVLARRAVNERARAQGTDHPAYASDLATLSYMTGSAEDRERAVAAYRAALDRLRGDPRARDTLALVANNLGYMLRRIGRESEAEPPFREALQVSRELHGDAHPRAILAMNHLTELLSVLGRRDEAHALLEERLAIKERERGPRHWRTAAAAESFARFHHENNAPDSAWVWYRTAHEILVDDLGPDDPRTAAVAAGLRTLCSEWRCP